MIKVKLYFSGQGSGELQNTTMTTPQSNASRPTNNPNNGDKIFYLSEHPIIVGQDDAAGVTRPLDGTFFWADANKMYDGYVSANYSGLDGVFVQPPSIRITQSNMKQLVISFDKMQNHFATSMTVRIAGRVDQTVSNNSTTCNIEILRPFEDDNGDWVIEPPFVGDITIIFNAVNAASQPLEITSIQNGHNQEFLDLGIVDYQVGKQSQVADRLPSYGVVSGYGYLNIRSDKFRELHQNNNLLDEVQADIIREQAEDTVLAKDVIATDFSQNLYGKTVNMELQDKVLSFADRVWEHVRFNQNNVSAHDFLRFIINDFLGERFEFFDNATRVIFDSIILPHVFVSAQSARDVLTKLLQITTSHLFFDEKGEIVVKTAETQASQTEYTTIKENNCFALSYDFFTARRVSRVPFDVYHNNSIQESQIRNVTTNTSNSVIRQGGNILHQSHVRPITIGGVQGTAFIWNRDTAWFRYFIVTQTISITFSRQVSRDPNDYDCVLTTNFGTRRAVLSNNDPNPINWTSPFYVTDDQLRELAGTATFSVQVPTQNTVTFTIRYISRVEFQIAHSTRPPIPPSPAPPENTSFDGPGVTLPPFAPAQANRWERGQQVVEPSINLTAWVTNVEHGVQSLGNDASSTFSITSNELIDTDSRYRHTPTNHQPLAQWLSNRIFRTYRNGRDIVTFSHIAKDHNFTLGQQVTFVDKDEEPMFNNKHFEIIDTQYDGSWKITAKEMVQ